MTDAHTVILYYFLSRTRCVQPLRQADLPPVRHINPYGLSLQGLCTRTAKGL
jgi:hypothetical protein